MAERRVLALLVGLLALCLPRAAAAQALSDLERARERWERLTPEQKAEARERYERFLALSDEARAELRARAERLREAREALVRGLPDDVRDGLERLGAAKRRELVGELFVAEVRERGELVRETLPEDLLARLEHARPEERPHLLQRFQRQQRGRVARARIGALGERLGLPPDEVERLQELPAEERVQAARELARRERAQRDEGGEAPLADPEAHFGLDGPTWERLSSLPPEQFLERVREHRARRLRELGVEGALDPRPAAGEGGLGMAGPESDGDGPRPRADGAPARPDRAAHALPLARLAQALRPDPREALALAELAAPQRRAELARRRRARCMEILGAARVLPPQRVAELGALDDEAFLDLVRALVAATGPRPPPPGQGPRPEASGREALPGPRRPPPPHPADGGRAQEPRGPRRPPDPGGRGAHVD